MAFGFFSKKPEKMQAKPAVKPRPQAEEATRPPPATLPPLDFKSATPTPPAEDDDDLDLDFTGIQLNEETDPLLAVIEQVAIDYANDHEDEALLSLRHTISAPDTSAAAERLWLMYFDLCQLTGNREAFSELELEYAQRFEKQPPVWKEAAAAAAVAATGATTTFKGDLLAANAAGFDLVAQVIEKGPKLKLDLGKVKSLDGDGCQRLLDLLARARKLKRETELAGLDALRALLDPLVAAEDRNQAYWRLLLEVLQRQERQEDFENIAVNFAVAFEISPPSYETPPPPAKPDKAAAKPVAATKATDDAFHIRGEVRNGKIDGLDAWVKDHNPAIIDMSAVTRMDFASAGTLLNILTAHTMRGVAVTLRHPHRLVAELLVVVGVGGVATILLSRK